MAEAEFSIRRRARSCKARCAIGPRKKAKALLALLALHPDGLGREALADRLFPDLGFEAGLHQLDVTLSTLRKALEPALAPRQKSRWLDTADKRVRLRADQAALELDVAAFDQAFAAGQRARAQGDGTAAEAAFARAAELYRGDLLDEPALLDLFDLERTGYRARALEALGALVALSVAAGRDEPARAYAERILALDPADEAAHRTLLRIFLRFGERDRARRQFALCEQALRAHLDAEPDAETRALARELR
jgi:DNA-binding SARP family transcriptional activator